MDINNKQQSPTTLFPDDGNMVFEMLNICSELM
jgi:hypothetical protein